MASLTVWLCSQGGESTEELAKSGRMNVKPRCVPALTRSCLVRFVVVNPGPAGASDSDTDETPNRRSLRRNRGSDPAVWARGRFARRSACICHAALVADSSERLASRSVEKGSGALEK
jgi:hypothetical protein